ncbi:MAG: hypothetical protein LUM44_10540 [Pyrinomonadaceae bacterium]|nr:hypothetical protein [Pyrinomonadaceae bacterium]
MEDFISPKLLLSLNFRETYLEISSTDKDYQKLFDFGGQISVLFDKSEIKNDPNTVAILDDLLGAIYCLILAKYHNFKDRSDQKIENEVIPTRAEQIKKGDVRIEGAWIAGWHFNSSLFRIAAIYHRLLKLIEGSTSKDYKDKLLKNVKKSYKNWTGEDWSKINTEAIHEEVNTLKHGIQGLYFARNVTFQHALTSISDLLKLIEAWSNANHNSN